jgi:hypothetical protein
MATKKTAEKKVAAKVEKKVAAKPVGHKKSSVKFVSFSFGATIPTQAFGNVTPRIEVTADSYEEARDFAIPKINEMYAHFAELKPVYLGKITETEKVVTPPAAVTPTSPMAHIPAQLAAFDAPAPQPTALAVPKGMTPKSDAVLKAEKAISLAMTIDATVAIEEQIQKSVKIPNEEKPALYTLVLKKRKELK